MDCHFVSQRFAIKIPGQQLVCPGMNFLIHLFEEGIENSDTFINAIAISLTLTLTLALMITSSVIETKHLLKKCHST